MTEQISQLELMFNFGAFYAMGISLVPHIYSHNSVKTQSHSTYLLSEKSSSLGERRLFDPIFDDITTGVALVKSVFWWFYGVAPVY